MQVTYSNGEYQKNGSVLGEARKLIRVRSISGALSLGQSHIPDIRETVTRIRDSDDELAFESELLHQIQEFIRGDYEGDVDIDFELTVTRDAVTGTAYAEFTPTDDAFTVSVSTDKDCEEDIKTLVDDVLKLFLQYNVDLTMISCESIVEDQAYKIYGHGTIGIPRQIEPSNKNLPLASKFPFSNIPFRRLLGL